MNDGSNLGPDAITKHFMNDNRISHIINIEKVILLKIEIKKI